MDSEAILLVEEYVAKRLEKVVPKTEIEFETYIVWKCKALQNWKYLISTTISDGMYYEMTYNGDKKEWYMDVYRKEENIVIKHGEAGQ